MVDFEYTEDTENKKKGKVINMSDIYDKRKEREREKLKGQISEDVDDVLGDFFQSIDKKFEERKEKKRTKIKTPIDKIINFFKIVGFIGLGILILNFILFNIWLLKYFIKSLIGF